MSPRRFDQLRPVEIQRGFTRMTPGSVLYRAGDTVVLCTVSIDEQLPPWMAGQARGWITAEYNMLPGSTSPRKPRERQKPDGRTIEIQRLIGRSLRAVVDLDRLGPRMVTVDCDVVQADGGTRTASITAATIALMDALTSIRDQLPEPNHYPMRDSVAAVSVGLIEAATYLDLDYELDARAEVDMNVVMTGAGRFVEVQATGEEATFSQEEFDQLLELARLGCSQLREIQRQTLGADWPFH